MNFFKSILLDDPDPPKPENPNEPGPNSHLNPQHDDRNPDGAAPADGDANGWSFGSLIKSLATRSESVIETYRKDLEEFGSGLRKETEIIREAASRAVKDLPASLEAGTSAAHDVLDGVLKSTAEIISKETQVFGSDGEPETPETNRGLNTGRYNRFEAQLSTTQSDLSTFCDEPEDVEEYGKWKLRFELEEKMDEIEGLIGENGNLEDVYRRVVPNVVDHETFWCRYFYRVDKLIQQERARANLVKRAISVDEDDDDDFSWDVDDDDEEKEKEKDGNASELTSGVKVKGGDGDGDNVVESNGSLNPVKIGESSNDGEVCLDEKEKENFDVDDGDKSNVVVEPSKTSSAEVSLHDKEVKSGEGDGVISDEKVKSEESVEGDGKKGDVSVAMNHQAKTEEDDLGWDEIEDIGSGDEKKVLTTTDGGRPHRAELRKQLNAAEDDEDLSWDIEDDDEPVKS